MKRKKIASTRHPLMVQIEKAIELVQKAQEITDAVMEEINGQPLSEYEAYGKYGFCQLLGEGNPLDNGLATIMEIIEERM